EQLDLKLDIHHVGPGEIAPRLYQAQGSGVIDERVSLDLEMESYRLGVGQAVAGERQQLLGLASRRAGSVLGLERSGRRPGEEEGQPRDDWNHNGKSHEPSPV